MLGLLVHTEWLHLVCSYINVLFSTTPSGLLFIPFLTSAHVILLTELQLDQPGNCIVGYPLVLFLCESLALTNTILWFIVSLFWPPSLPIRGGFWLVKVKLNICSLFSVPILGLHYDDDGDYYYCYYYNLLKVTLDFWKSKSIGWLLKWKNVLKQLWSCHWNGIITFQKLKLLSCYKKNSHSFYQWFQISKLGQECRHHKWKFPAFLTGAKLKCMEECFFFNSLQGNFPERCPIFYLVSSNLTGAENGANKSYNKNYCLVFYSRI